MQNLLFWCIIPSIILNEGRAYLKHAATMEESTGSFCIEVGSKEDINELPSQPKMVLILKVAYPNYSVSEAGKTIINEEDLFHGKHNITYKHYISNMAHDLQVQLDGSKKKFIKPDESGWYSVSSFREIDVLTQGKIKIGPCSGNVVMKDTEFHEDSNYMNKDSVESNERFFLADSDGTENYLFGDLERKPSSESVYDKLGTTANSVFLELENKTNLTFKVKLETTESPNFVALIKTSKPSSIGKNISVEVDNVPHDFGYNLQNSTVSISSDQGEINKSFINNSNHNYNYNESLINIFMNNGNLSKFSHTENVLSAHENHTYAIAVVLVVSLVGLVLVAIIVSVIFHRKNKKLVLAKPRPKNKLHKLYESTEGTAETSVMLEKLESTLESEC